MNTDRISKIFATCRAQNRKALVVFAACGCPDIDTTEKLIATYIENGADIIELGVPFSDPMADGPVIQQASQLAIQNGATFRDIIQLTARLRARFPHTGLIIFSYFNILLNHCLSTAARDLKTAGADGILAVDLPYEERDELKTHTDREHLHLIPLISPATPPARAKLITGASTGFVYYVTVRGVTGTRTELPPDLASHLQQLRQLSPIPIVAGFGISTPDSAQQAAQHADGIVIGSALVQLTLKIKDRHLLHHQSATLTKSISSALRS